LPPNVPLSQQTPKVESAAVSKTTAPTDLGVTAEQKRLLDIMLDPQYPPQERAEAGREINKVGDPRPGVIDFNFGADYWCKVPVGKFIMGSDHNSFHKTREEITPYDYWVAKCPITYAQYQTFIVDPNGYRNEQWWKGLHADGLKQQKEGVGNQEWKFSNHPAENVSWYDAMAFCAWLNVRLVQEKVLRPEGFVFRLPTEKEWEKAARGTDGREYPYAGKFDATKGNTKETGIKQTSAIGIFLDGTSPYGIMDMNGNVLEWMLTEHSTEYISPGISNNRLRELRGGSWNNGKHYALTASRANAEPDWRSNHLGFRIVFALPAIEVSPVIRKAVSPIVLRGVSEQKRLLDIMFDPTYLPVDRAEAGREMNKVGDPRLGVVDFNFGADYWCKVPKGKFIMGSEDYKRFATIQHDYWLAKYLITYAQYKMFLDDPKGYHDTRWWNGLHVNGLREQKEGAGNQKWKIANHPAENVSWYDAMAFCAWLNGRLRVSQELKSERLIFRLPTDKEWEKAARGTDGREYPYGNEFDATKGNTQETEIGQTSAVGMFLSGASPYGAFDMSGNVQQWTVTDNSSKTYRNFHTENARMIRGGSWDGSFEQALASSHYADGPAYRANDTGFRIVYSVPLDTPGI